MKWRGRKGSSNVRRSSGSRNRSPGFGTGGRSGGFRIPGGALGGGGGIIGFIIILAFVLLTQRGGGGGGETRPPETQNPAQIQSEQEQAATGQGDPANEEEMRQFVSVVLKDTEDAWKAIFSEQGREYREPTLHVFTGSVRTACGGATDQIGPFYCPADETVYIDLTFYQELRQKFGVAGDFTMAYVISHEVGHHVQNLLGILEDVHREQKGKPKAEQNALNVRLELQADYLAGVVAHWQDKQGYLEEGDIGEAIRAAEAIGDDTIQKRSRGYAVPDTFTHGTSEQRQRW